MGFCPNCGTKNEGNLNFCANCGTNLNPGVTNNVQPQNNMYANYATYQQPVAKTEKNGKSIASMVLGIIAIVWTLMSLGSADRIEVNLIESLAKNDIAEIPGKIAFALGFNFFSLVCGTIGLILGLKTKKNGKAIAGIIMSSISLLVAVIMFIYILTISV